MHASLVVTVALCAACASEPASCPVVEPGGPYPAPHPPTPLLANQGGSVLAAPRVVPIFYPGFSFRTQVLLLASKLGGSEYWSATTAEYGIGPLAMAAPIDLTEAAPASQTQVQLETWLVDHLNSGAFGAPDPEAIYTVYLPPSSEYVRTDGRSCVASDGFHASVVVDGHRIAYAVIATCDHGPLSPAAEVTAISSHEWIEAATNPRAAEQPALAGMDRDAAPWAFVFGLEASDLCEHDGAPYVTPTDIGLTVQRSWSNTRARAGHDPCVPSPPDAYFAAVPDLDASGVVHIAGDSSQTIDVVLFSDNPIGAWELSAVDTGRSTLGLDSQLSFDWDCTTGGNGDTRRLTIHVDRPSSSKFEIVTIVASGFGRSSRWPIMITN